MRWTTIGLALIGSAVGAVPESDFYPIIEYWKAGDFRANQLCEGDGGAPAPDTKAKRYGFRSSIGLRELSAKLLKAYAQKVYSSSLKDLIYDIKLRRKYTIWDSLLELAIKGSVVSYRSDSEYASFRDSLCAAFDTGLAANTFCYAMGNYSQGVGCMSNYAYEDPDSIMKEISPQNNFGYTEPDASCFVLASGQNGLDLPLQQFSLTPNEIDRATAQSEEKTYFALWKALDKLQRYAEFKFLVAVDQLEHPESSAAAVRGAAANLAARKDVGIHDLFRDTDIFDEILPGWKVLRVFDMNEPRFLGGPTLRTPYAIMAAKQDDVLIVLRRPLTTYDGRLALYNQQSFKYLYNFTGEVHDGSSTIFQTLSGVLEFDLGAFYETRTLQLGQPAFVTIVAAGLPSSGAAVILASHLERVMTDKYGTGAIKLNAVSFGSPTVSDPTFVEKIRRTIEVRSVLVEGDSTDLFPCPTTFSCDERDLLPRTGIETGIEYVYQSLPGRYIIPLSKLATLDPAWGDESAAIQLAGIKDCAYSCYLAKTQCSSDPEAAKCNPKECESFLLDY